MLAAKASISALAMGHAPRIARRLLQPVQGHFDDVEALVQGLRLLGHGLRSFGAWLSGARRACSLARRRDRGCKRSGGFAGNRLQGSRPCDPAGPAQPEAGRKPLRSAPGAEPQATAARSAAQQARRLQGAWRAAPWREAPTAGRRRAKRARRGGPAGGAQRRDRARPPAGRKIGGVAGEPRSKGSDETRSARTQGKAFPTEPAGLRSQFPRRGFRIRAITVVPTQSREITALLDS
jgi:hypothetical protein